MSSKFAGSLHRQELLQCEQQQIPENVGIGLPISAVILGKVERGIVQMIENERARQVVRVVQQRRLMDEEKRQGQRSREKNEESNPQGVRFPFGFMIAWAPLWIAAPSVLHARYSLRLSAFKEEGHAERWFC